MPNIKSAKKRVKIIETKTLRNKSVKSAMKTHIRKFESAIQEGDKEKSKSLLDITQKEIDKAAAKGIIHKNTAARKKSLLTKSYNKLVYND
ncbi:MAG: 30S ribosomal protein S20 [Clostridia bacterium]|nr:30S ribosomal protein S20 [Clostridia bacterium]